VFRGRFPGAAPQCILQRLQGRFRRLPGSRRAEVFRKDIDVTVLYPGFIDTPLNQMLPKRPFARLLKILPTAVIGRM
jgi:NAD(P)-dependent dehydrogenase (short-subunit alcohol dehydrogenase family)